MKHFLQKISVVFVSIVIICGIVGGLSIEYHKRHNQFLDWCHALSGSNMLSTVISDSYHMERFQVPYVLSETERIELVEILNGIQSSNVDIKYKYPKKTPEFGIYISSADRSYLISCYDETEALFYITPATYDEVAEFSVGGFNKMVIYCQTLVDFVTSKSLLSLSQ